MISILILGACGKKKDEAVMEDDPLITTELETEGGSVESGDGYGFDIFIFELTTNSGETIDISYDVSGKSAAKYEDSREDIHLADEKAMDKASLLFDEIRIEKETSEDQVIERLLDELNVDAYNELKLFVNFDEGTELQIDKKQ